ncbi:MAG: DUF5667 domain-containing protein [Patescibacteria group bacterium]
MINKKFDNLIEQLKAIKLTSVEKSDILARTFSVIEGIEAVTTPVKTTQQFSFSSVTWSLYINNRKFVPSLVIVALLFVTGGASLAAEGSLPGDSLYSVKINVNEEVRGLTAVTPESKARVAVEATERRLQEAATLSARGQLNDQTKSIVQSEFKKHATQVQSRVASLVSENNLTAAQEVAVNYESSLRAHEIILEKISSDQVDDSTQHLSSLIDTVKTELATSTVSRVDIQSKEIQATLDPKASAENKIIEVRVITDETINLRIENLALLSTTTAALVAGKIIEAQVLTVKAQGYMASSSYSEALTTLQQASTVLSDAEGAVSVEAGLDKDVKKALGVPSGSIESSTTTASTTISVSESFVATSSVGTN